MTNQLLPPLLLLLLPLLLLLLLLVLLRLVDANWEGCEGSGPWLYLGGVFKMFLMAL